MNQIFMRMMTMRVLRSCGIAMTGIALLLGAGCASFHLTSTPPADIYENDEKIGRTPYSFALMAGDRTFTLKRSGYVEKELVVTSLERKRIHCDLQWVGKTRVATQPPGAQVIRIEDGEVLGITPCALYLSRAEQIELKLEGFERAERILQPNRRYEVQLDSKEGYRTAHYQQIVFSSKQGPVEIFDQVAGELIGITPVELNIESGAALEYRRPGFHSGFDLISRNAPHHILIELEPVHTVMLDGPPGAEVFRAGGSKKLGELPFGVEVRGDAVYEIRKAGYRDRLLSVSTDSPARLPVVMEEIPFKIIETDPPGGTVYRLGGIEQLGQAPYTAVVEHERIFEIRKEGFMPYVIGVGPASPARLKIVLKPLPHTEPDAAAIGVFDSRAVKSF